VMRLREEMAWKDRLAWYGASPPRRHQLATAAATNGGGGGGGCGPTSSVEEACTGRGEPLGMTDPTAGFLMYEPKIPPTLLRLEKLPSNGGIPVNHLALMHEQLRQLRNAFFMARALGRALILPHT
jgi:hypothetical protein